ncbi:hypothetical protein BY996DRAFT_2114670 [Phakopsora pachyrhizi]|nr:hypothetical protein BY996DRAFT_2114670 [Phakopsora pachyrhizi]
MKLFSCTNEWNILPFVLLSAWYTRTVLGMHFAESSKENIISSAKGLLQEQPPENIPITQGISIRTEGQDSLSINAEVKEPKWHCGPKFKARILQKTKIK